MKPTSPTGSSRSLAARKFSERERGARVQSRGHLASRHRNYSCHAWWRNPSAPIARWGRYAQDATQSRAPNPQTTRPETAGLRSVALPKENPRRSEGFELIDQGSVTRDVVCAYALTAVKTAGGKPSASACAMSTCLRAIIWSRNATRSTPASRA